MKLIQIIDKEIHQNEIESKYIWDISSYDEPQAINRINLSTFEIELYLSKPIWIKYSMTLPENQMFGIYSENLQEDLQFLLISDENLNIKPIQINKRNMNSIYYFASCFYDEAIFAFETEYNSSEGGIISQHAKKYIISQNKWVYLSAPPCYYPISCTGINQKIIIAENVPFIWVYDIFLDSYSYIFIKHFDKKADQMLLKISGRIYLLVFSYINEIYCCDDPLSEWIFLCSFEDNLFGRDMIPQVYYDGSIYYLRGHDLYKFSLTKFKSKKTKMLAANNIRI